DHQIGIQLQYFIEIGINEIGNFRLFFSCTRRPSGEPADTYQSVLFTYGIKDFSTFFGQANDSLWKPGLEHSAKLNYFLRMDKARPELKLLQIHSNGPRLNFLNQIKLMNVCDK